MPCNFQSEWVKWLKNTRKHFAPLFCSCLLGYNALKRGREYASFLLRAKFDNLRPFSRIKSNQMFEHLRGESPCQWLVYLSSVMTMSQSMNQSISIFIWLNTRLHLQQHTHTYRLHAKLCLSSCTGKCPLRGNNPVLVLCVNDFAHTHIELELMNKPKNFWCGTHAMDGCVGEPLRVCQF